LNSDTSGKWGSLEVERSEGLKVRRSEGRKSEEDRVVAMSGGGFSGAERTISTGAKGSFNCREAAIQPGATRPFNWNGGRSEGEPLGRLGWRKLRAFH